MQDEVETPWRKSLCKVVPKGEGSLEDLEPDGSTKSNLWSDAPFMSFTTLSRIVRGGVMLLHSRAVSHDRTVPTDRPIPHLRAEEWGVHLSVTLGIDKAAFLQVTLNFELE